MSNKKTLNITPVPVDPSAHHPPSPYTGILPDHEFTMGLIAPKGSGKTTLIIRLLEFYKDYFHNIIIFSPTCESDEKWEYIMKKPLLAENVKLIKFLNKRGMKTNEIVGKPGMVVEKLKKKHDPVIPKECLINRYDEDTLKKLLDDQLAQISALSEMGKNKYLANRILLIFDDLVGSALFSAKSDNFFTGFNTRHRHYSASIMMVTQAYKAIPFKVRTNFSCIIMFEIANQKEVEAVYEEWELGLKRDKWQEMYDYCVTDSEYDFMFINIKKKKKTQRVMKNFNEIVYFCDTKNSDDKTKSSYENDTSLKYKP